MWHPGPLDLGREDVELRHLEHLNSPPCRKAGPHFPSPPQRSMPDHEGGGVTRSTTSTSPAHREGSSGGHLA